MRNQKVRVFELSNRGVFSKCDEENIDKDSPLTDENETNELEHLVAHDSNPFEYSLTDKNDKTTIEDFSIIYKKEKIILSDVVYNKKYSVRKKRKIIKKIFKEWKNDYDKKRIDKIEDTNLSTDLFDSLNFNKVSLKRIILLLIISFITYIFVFLPEKIINIVNNIPFINNLFPKIESIYQTNSLSLFLGYGLFGILIFTVIISIIYNFSASPATKMKRWYTLQVSSTGKKVERDFNKKYTKALKYYLRKVNHRNKPFQPLQMKTIYLKKNIEYIDDINKKMRRDVTSLKKRFGTLKKIKKLCFVLTFLMLAIYIVFLIYCSK